MSSFTYLSCNSRTGIEQYGLDPGGIVKIQIHQLARALVTYFLQPPLGVLLLQVVGTHLKVLALKQQQTEIPF